MGKSFQISVTALNVDIGQTINQAIMNEKVTLSYTLPLPNETSFPCLYNNVLKKDQNVISCSSDTSVIIWNIENQTPYVFSKHKDYVKTLCEWNSSQFVSGGLDKSCMLWDVETEDSIMAIVDTCITTSSGIYAMASLPLQSLIAVGCNTENVIKLYDVRSGKHESSLKGHSDNIKDILIVDELIFSASADGTIRKWSLSNHRCIETFDHHEDCSVWRLKVDSKGNIWSSDRNGSIYSFSSANDAKLRLECPGGVLDFLVDETDGKLLVSSMDPAIRAYDLDTKEKIFDYPSTPGITKFRLLNDRQHLVSQTVDRKSQYWDILTGQVLQVKEKDTNFEEYVEEKQMDTWCNNWCSIDIRTGRLRMKLKENFCFSSDLYLSDVKYPKMPEDSDYRGNIGLIIIHSLLSNYVQPLNVESSPATPGNSNTDYLSDIDYSFFKLPSSTKVRFDSEPDGYLATHTLYSSTISEISNRKDDISPIMPRWIEHALLYNQIPIKSTTKIPVELINLTNKAATPDSNTNLTIHPMVRIRKLGEFLKKELCLKENADVKFYLNDVLLDSNINIGTLKMIKWKKGGDIPLGFYVTDQKNEIDQGNDHEK
ncbi:hypothetical protein O9G_002815 [Rozella allomycis CSF55]|uniref:Uncharacterized protein n=1 Tax=Rozella allomycis (strain CSF55) TaxID=988480 RepID=A0A075AW10_ROZAC|nr:hypothetical protein O9G_002815 [Rozella allomycis CSF55]|eukprot:EPZ32897.1 hypothetical protein O9G_002815 [Rozella allomycis CSF55]